MVEQHVSFGLSYWIGDRSLLDFGYTHAFKHTISEQGTNLLGAATALSSSLSEDSFELGFHHRF